MKTKYVVASFKEQPNYKKQKQKACLCVQNSSLQYSTDNLYTYVN